MNIRTFGRLLGRILASITILVVLAFVFGPKVRVSQDIRFDRQMMGRDLDAYLAASEAPHAPTPGTEKSIIWAGEPGVPTPISLVYLHGYSATHREIAPVPEQLAAALGANLYQARLKGHGVAGDLMGTATPDDWLLDASEAFAIGERIGGRVYVIGVSTGATIATIAAVHPDMAETAAGFIFVSPNFRVDNPLRFIVNFPFLRQIVPMLVGPRHVGHPQTPDHGRFWTMDYPTTAHASLGAILEAAENVDHGAISAPVLALYSPEDQVVNARFTAKLLSGWGGKVTTVAPVLGDGIEPANHVIAGDILSPRGTAWALGEMLAWIKDLESTR